MKRPAVTAALTLGVLLGTTGTAGAHVTASAPDAAPDAYSVVTLRVPTESETAGTVGFEVTLPTDHPLAVVRNATTPGWDVALRRTTAPTPIDNGHGGKVTEFVSSVTFTARPGTAIAPGEFAEFRLLLGPLPNVRELVLPAIQTYSDGTQVSWIERSTDGSTPDKPAPTIRLAAAGHANHNAPDHNDPATPQAAPAQDDSSSSGSWLGGLALIAALVALVLAGLPLVRSARAK
ncbi:YcnI family protein [Nocardia sp. NPDC050712]|uniref:YcnI family copper-binding membrane protein n=1 Tax=Nocardia sp. NPDC050712 TaxID=3155518 RepID=UPI0033D536B1